jgi:guanylate kinase
VNEAVDKILAAGKAFGMPVAMNGAANAKQRMEQGARIFMGAPATSGLLKELGR